MKQLLADLIIYRSNIQTIHWKMFGSNFLGIHKLTDKMYLEINEFIDRIVEKHIQKDKVIKTTLKDFIVNATIDEEASENISVQEGIEKLVLDGKNILSQAEKAYDKIESLGTMDLVLDDLREYIEKTLWLLQKSKK